MVNRWGKQEKSALRTVIFIWEAGKMNDPLIREIQVKSVITKSNLPVCEMCIRDRGGAAGYLLYFTWGLIRRKRG